MAVCIFLAHPMAAMGFIDDWSYAKTAQVFAQTGHFVYNGWATAMLGWQVWWAALFIKLFGFSFNVVHLSTLPLAFLSVVLFHEILVRCGITPRNAILGTLTLALSPLFLVLTASYMSDIPGILCVLLCLYCCLRAIQASTDRATVAWLILAAASNVALGTARQIAWLGALVMVPGTAWLLRRRKGVLPTGIALWIASITAIFLCMHWYKQQLYSAPERLLPDKLYLATIIHFLIQVIKAPFCLLLVLLPILAAWLPGLRTWPLRRRVGLAAGLLAVLVFWLLQPPDDGSHSWLMPWLPHVLGELNGATSAFLLGKNPAALGFWPRAAVSLVVIAAGAAVLVDTLRRVRPGAGRPGGAHAPAPVSGPAYIGWRPLLWLTAPFFLSYAALLLPRALLVEMFDRYFLTLMPFAILLLLRFYQDYVGSRLPAISWWVLAIFTLYSMAGVHDIFSFQRARVKAGEDLRMANIPRTAITGGLEYDGWTQIEAEGYVHYGLIKIPAGASMPRKDYSDLPEECTYWFYPETPAIKPKYYVVSSPLPCLAPSAFPPVTYSAWLPPFHRELYIQQRK